MFEALHIVWLKAEPEEARLICDAPSISTIEDLAVHGKTI
jgi:hypothetical protein